MVRLFVTLLFPTWLIDDYYFLLLGAFSDVVI